MTTDEQMDDVARNVRWLETEQRRLLRRRRTTAAPRTLVEIRRRLQHEGRHLERLFRQSLALIPLTFIPLALLLTGCAGPRTSPSAATRSTPPTLLISWSHPATNVTFNIYSAPVPSLDAMTLRTNTASRSVSFPVTRTNEFFAVRAARGQQLSDWGTK